jgi:hypothetical protein
MLGPLSVARLRVVLLPSKARLLPLAEHVLHQIGPELGVNLTRLLLMGAFGRGQVLSYV